jgi:hypothetical protein
MWPWEHAALGYLLYSLSLRALGRNRPSDIAVIALAVATQFPDLVDKPLSWGFGVFPTGYALGHSVFLAVPLGVGLLAWGVRDDRKQVAVAFVVGYWAHLVADVLDPLRYGATPLPGRVLWPVVAQAPYERDLGFGRGLAYLTEFLTTLGSMDPFSLVVVYLLLPIGTVAVWLWDGMPGLTPIVRVIVVAGRKARNVGR